MAADNTRTPHGRRSSADPAGMRREDAPSDGTSRRAASTGPGGTEPRTPTPFTPAPTPIPPTPTPRASAPGPEPVGGAGALSTPIRQQRAAWSDEAWAAVRTHLAGAYTWYRDNPEVVDGVLAALPPVVWGVASATGSKDAFAAGIAAGSAGVLHMVSRWEDRTVRQVAAAVAVTAGQVAFGYSQSAAGQDSPAASPLAGASLLAATAANLAMPPYRPEEPAAARRADQEQDQDRDQGRDADQDRGQGRDEGHGPGHGQDHPAQGNALWNAVSATFDQAYDVWQRWPRPFDRGAAALSLGIMAAAEFAGSKAGFGAGVAVGGLGDLNTGFQPGASRRQAAASAVAATARAAYGDGLARPQASEAGWISTAAPFILAAARLAMIEPRKGERAPLLPVHREAAARGQTVSLQDGRSSRGRRSSPPAVAAWAGAPVVGRASGPDAVPSGRASAMSAPAPVPAAVPRLPARSRSAPASLPPTPGGTGPRTAGGAAQSSANPAPAAADLRPAPGPRPATPSAHEPPGVPGRRQPSPGRRSLSPAGGRAR